MKLRSIEVREKIAESVTVEELTRLIEWAEKLEDGIYNVVLFDRVITFEKKDYKLLIINKEV